MHSPTQHAFQLLKKSFLLLLPIKRFLLMPAICTLVDIGILAAIVTPIHRMEMLQQPFTRLQWEQLAFFFALYLLFIYFTNLILYFSHGTLMNAATADNNGEKTSLIKTLKLTCRHYPSIFLWVTYASTIGIFLAPFKRRYSTQLWGVANFFVLPILLEFQCAPREALQRSAELMTKTWGETLTPQFRSAGLVVMFFLLSFIPALIAILIGGKIALSIGIVLTVLLIVSLSIIFISARTLLIWNLYQFASGKKIPVNLNPELLKTAFSQAP
jgi:hypothetical protein